MSSKVKCSNIFRIHSKISNADDLRSINKNLKLQILELGMKLKKSDTHLCRSCQLTLRNRSHQIIPEDIEVQEINKNCEHLAASLERDGACDGVGVLFERMSQRKGGQLMNTARYISAKKIVAKRVSSIYK